MKKAHQRTIANEPKCYFSFLFFHDNFASLFIKSHTIKQQVMPTVIFSGIPHTFDLFICAIAFFTGFYPDQLLPSNT